MRRKTRYTILDSMDEQERVELRPKFSESRLRLSRLAPPAGAAAHVSARPQASNIAARSTTPA